MEVRNLIRPVQQGIGEVIHRTMPGVQTDLLQGWATAGASLSDLRRWLFEGVAQAIDREYYRARTGAARRATLRALCLGRDSLQQDSSDRPTPARSLFAALAALLSSGRVASVHEVACGSGHEIAFLARQHPGIAFRGSDPDPHAIDHCLRRWRGIPNLSFTTLRPDRADDDFEMHRLRADAVFATGGLHYLDEAALRAFLVRARKSAQAFLLSQPADATFAADADPQHARPRGRLSWNHPYARYLRDAGWPVVEVEIERQGPDAPCQMSVVASTAPLPRSEAMRA